MKFLEWLSGVVPLILILALIYDFTAPWRVN